MGKICLKLQAYIDSLNITRYQLADLTKIRYDTIDKYYKNKVQRYDTYILAKICDALDCELWDIVEYEKANCEQEEE